MVSAKMILRTVKRRMAIALAVCGALLLIALGEGRLAFAHESAPLLVELSINQNQAIHLQVRLDLERHLALWESGASSEHSEAARVRYEKLQALPARLIPDRLQQALLQGFNPVQLTDGSNRRVNLRLDSVYVDEPSQTAGGRNTTISLFARLPDNKNGVRLHSGSNQVAMIISQPDTNAEKHYVRAGEYSAPFGPEGFADENGISSFSRYLSAGFSHILPKGIDHVLFVAGLVLFAPAVKRLALQVSLFTLAHSVTLVLGVLGLVNVPGAVVEPLIAASIIYVCVDNLRAAGTIRLRGFVIILFGLLHGLGFASMLDTAGLQTGALAEALVAFNLGIELAQLAVVVVLASLLAVLQKYNPFQLLPVATSASVLIGIAGTWMLIERVAV